MPQLTSEKLKKVEKESRISFSRKKRVKKLRRRKRILQIVKIDLQPYNNSNKERKFAWKQNLNKSDKTESYLKEYRMHWFPMLAKYYPTKLECNSN
jgi:hypothetical protein